jgi:prepilin-type N-terminal cleavage/methylation domain-containing protein
LAVSHFLSLHQCMALHKTYIRLRWKETSTQGGFTLFEMIITIGLLALLSTFSLVMGTRAIGDSYLRAERDTVVIALLSARVRSGIALHGKKHGLSITEDTLTLFEGDSFASATNKKEWKRKGTIAITGPTEIVFDALSGKVAKGFGTLRLTDGENVEEIAINTQGRIDWR